MELLRFYAEPFLTLAAKVAQWQEVANSVSATTANKKLTKLFPNGIPVSDKGLLAEIRSLCEKLGLSSSLRQLDTLERVIRNENTTFARFTAATSQLRVRVVEDIEQELLFHVPPSRAQYFNNPTFGDSIAVAFPAATLDIEEAGKCFALGRWTACVFHLMRVMEHGMDALAAHMGLLATYKTWEKKIEKMSSYLVEELRKPYGESDLVGNLDFFKQATERLTAVQHALRNETMHARSFYDEERAADIYASVKGFMRQLATQLKATPP